MMWLAFLLCIPLSVAGAVPAYLLLDGAGVAKPMRIPIVELASCRYIALEALQSSKRQHLRPDVAQLGRWTFRWCAPGFFFLVEGEGMRQVLQSLRPAIVRNGKILVPLDDWLGLLAQRGFIRWNPATLQAKVLPFPLERQHPQAPLRYQLPPSLRRPSLEQLQSQTERRKPSDILRASALLASTALVPVEQQTPATITRIVPRVYKDTTRIQITLSHAVPPEAVHADHRGRIIRLALDGVSEKGSDLAPLKKIRFRRFRLEHSERGATLVLELTQSGRTVRVFPQSARTFVLEIAPSGESVRSWLDCIVLDPGHGGHDVGAIGVRGTLEKTVTLAVATRLERHLRALLPGVRVVLTRRDDRFVELHRRTEIANRAGGDVFISLHCNAAQTKPHPARGVEVYVLSPSRSDEAARVAARENASIELERDRNRYPLGQIEHQILASAAQHGMLDLSHLLAATLDSTLQHQMHSPSRGVQSAGFLVLVGAAMPSVLVEMGFLSNAEEERLLASAAYQERLAHSIATAVVRFVRHYDRMVTLTGAER
ncbi:N-acetylmuramoyl-L-alanine amidase AmiA [bacterium HR20]|nr:N-acetylmuramoyl-L-alanine amidase AmiA [bacterium HR20]